MDQKAPSALQDIALGCSVTQLVILPDMTLAMNYDAKKRALMRSRTTSVAQPSAVELDQHGAVSDVDHIRLAREAAGKESPHRWRGRRKRQAWRSLG